MIPLCQIYCSETCMTDPSAFGLCTNRDHLRAEGRRYLYRNVACEARKPSGLEKHMPDVQGWT